MIARLAAVATALVLGACAMFPAQQPLPTLQSVPQGFEMSGRLAVRSGDHNEIAALRWTRNGSSDVWILSSPLGNEVARIESDADGATLFPAGGVTQQAPSFQALTQRLLGVALDPAWLAAALHGKASADLPAEWKITIDEKQSQGAVELARRITAVRGDVVVKLVVDSYRALAR
jgi:outer membrane lipoprotein LolB